MLSLVVPTYNEASNLPELVGRIGRTLNGRGSYEIVVVDDNSPDGTAAVAQSLAEEYPVRVIVRKSERGLASAVLEGFRRAVGDVIGTINADLQHPPETLREMLQQVEAGADVAVASRYEIGGGIEKWTLGRRVVSYGARLLAYALVPSSRRTRDPLSGFYLLRSSVITDVDLRPVGYKTLLEILVRGKPQRVASVPYSFADRKSGVSKCGLRQELDYLHHLARLMPADRELQRFLRFCLVGAGGVLVNTGVLWFLTDIVGLFYLLSSVIAVECAMVTNFLWNDAWTFRDRRSLCWRERVTRLAKYNAVSVVGLGINVMVLWLFTSKLGVYYLLSNLVGIATATVWRFSINSRWTWGLRLREKPR